MVFILSAFWGISIWGLWKLPDGRDWLRGKLGLVLMGRAMLGKSLMQSSVDGWGCVPAQLFDLRPNYGGGNEENGDLLQKIPCTHCLTQCLWPCRGHCRLTPPPGTPGHSQASLGQTLGGVTASSSASWCAHDFVCASKSLFPQSCVSSGGSMVGLMATSSKRAYAIPRSAAPRAPAPGAGHCWLVPPQKMLKHSKASLVPSLWGILVRTRFCVSLLSISGRYGIWF